MSSESIKASKVYSAPNGKTTPEEVKSYVDSRLVLLHSLKQHKYPTYWSVKSKYKMQNLPIVTEGGYTDYSMNTQFAIVQTKSAEVLNNTPRYDFIALDANARRYKRLRELFWDYVWLTSKTDKAIYAIVFDAMKYGVGFGKETYVCEDRKVKMPKTVKEGEEDKIVFEEVIIEEYEGCRLTYIPWGNVWLNGRDIEETTEAVIITYFDRAKFFEVYGRNPNYSNISESSIPVGKYYYVGDNTNGLIIDGNSTSTSIGNNGVENNHIVSVLEYYNKYRDEYIILANGVWINPYNNEVMPNPNPSKEIPIVVYTDIYVDDDIYGLGEFEITDKSCALKDETRSLSIETVKAQGGIITIDPASEFDDSIMEFGIRKYARVEKDAFGFFAPSINTGTLQYVEQKADEDIIIESGIDFRSQLLNPNETATKTQGRINASLKRISLGVKYNAYTFYERLARLRMANMEFYKEKPVDIQTKNISIDKDGNVEYHNSGYGLFTMMPEYFSGKLSMVLAIDSMVGNTTAENKQKWLETAQLLMNMVDPDTGKPMYHPSKIVESGRGIIDEVIDLDKLSEKVPTTQSAESMLAELDSQAGVGTLQGGEAGMEAQNASYVPPAQRSGKPMILPSSPNLE